MSNMECVTPESATLPARLGEILGRELPTVRKVPGQDLYSLADVGGAITGKNGKDAAQDLRRVLKDLPNLGTNQGTSFSLVKFTTKRRHPVDVKVGDLPLVVGYIMRLPGHLQRREEIAELIVQHWGGSADIVRNVTQNLPARPPDITDTDAITPEMVALPAGLEELLGRDKLPGMRKVPGQELYSLADIGKAITGKNANDAGQDLRRVGNRFPEVHSKCLNFKIIGGRGTRSDLKLAMGDLPLVVEYIMLLPGKTAARIRAHAAKLLVRYLGGDLKLIDEVQQLHHVQEHLKEVDPTDWRRAFGEYTENAASSSDLDGVEVEWFDQAPEKMGADHLYALQTNVPNVYKIGHSQDPLKRCEQLMRSESIQLKLRAVWKNEKCLETLVHKSLPPAPSECNFKSREFHQTSYQDILEAVNNARNTLKMMLNSSDEDSKLEFEFKRKRMVMELEMETESKQLDIEKKRKLTETDIETYREAKKIEIEGMRLELDMKRWEFESKKTRA